MKHTAPKIDKRSFQVLLKQMRAKAPFYTSEWKSTYEQEAGRALLKIYLHLLQQTIARLNRVPDKNFIAFLDLLGIDILPAQSARAVVTFALAEGTTEHVTVPQGTQLAGEGAEDGEEVIFETVADLRVSPSQIQEIFSVNARSDRIFTHTQEFANNQSFKLFSEQNQQERSLYIGHADLLSQTNPTNIKLTFNLAEGATAGALDLSWEYWNGERWFELEKFNFSESEEQEKKDETNLLNQSGEITVEKQQLGEFATLELYGMESRWLRCQLNNRLSAPNLIRLPTVNTIRLTVAPIEPFPAELAFNNDIPIDLEERKRKLQLEVIKDHGIVLSFSSSASQGESIISLNVSGGDIQVNDFVRLDNGTNVSEIRQITAIASSTPNAPKVLTLDRQLEFNYDLASAKVQFYTAVRGREVELALVPANPPQQGAKEIFLNVTSGELLVNDFVRLSNNNVSEIVEIQAIDPIDSTKYLLSEKLKFGYGVNSRVNLAYYYYVNVNVNVNPTEKFSSLNKSIVLEELEGNTEIVPIKSVTLSEDGEFITDLVIGKFITDLVIRYYAAEEFVSVVPTIKPFGEVPGLFDTFFIASDEAFSKKGADLTLEIESEWANKEFIDIDEPNPVLSWEYWNGKNWHILQLIDGTDRFRQSDNITFTGPQDIEKIEVNGEEKYWIRVRIIDGDYGKEFIIVPIEDSNPPEVEFKSGKIHYPIIYNLKIDYQDIPRPPQQCFSLNNLDFRDHIREVTDTQKVFAPFEILNEQTQSLFLGFDNKLEGGPIRILFDLTEQILSEDELLEVQWFYWNGKKWIQLNVFDDTESLTKIGLLEFAVPNDFTNRELFDKDSFWLKANVVEGEFVKDNDSEDRSLEFPEIKGIFPNSVYAIQASIVEDEILGSSDLTSNQEFQLLNPLVISQEVLITEPNPPSEDERKVILQEEGEDAIEEFKNELGEIESVRVRWHEVEDFNDSDSKSRHYIVDKRLGIIKFGDGVNGMVPPLGADNIRANYRYGGGRNGNVLAEKITSLKNAIPFVNEVTNHLPAEGGSATETLDEVLVRGPQKLKNRDRAVTCEDFESLARNAARTVARAKCLPNTDENGERAWGHVTAIVVPDTQEANEQPSRLLINIVLDYLKQHSANLVSAGDRIHVIGVDYVEIAVEPTIVPTSLKVVARVEKGVLAALKRYIHPLRGGPLGEGWEFGQNISRSNIFALLEGVEGVDYVKELSVRVNGEIREGDVEIDERILPFSGEHQVKIVLEPDSRQTQEKKKDSTCQEVQTFNFLEEEKCK